MAELRLRRGECAVSLVLGRRIFPQEFLVTHYDPVTKHWYADATNSDFRIAGVSRNDVMDLVYAHVMDPPRQPKKGRPRRNRINTMLTLPPTCRDYLAELSTVTETSWSTLVAYLITKAYAAYKLQGCDELPDSERYGSDDSAWVDAQYRNMGVDRPRQEDAGRAIEALRAENEATMTALAQKIRESIEAPQNAKDQEFRAAKPALIQAEIEANKRLDHE